MLHYYYLVFSVFKRGEMSRRPYTVQRYVTAQNRQEAYRKAQKICDSRRIGSLSDVVRCRHQDIHRETKQTALQDINEGYVLENI